MAFRTTRSLLDKARACHHELSDIYAQLEAQAEKEQVKRLLDFLKRHELALERSLKEFEDDLPSDILDTWFKNTPSESHWHALSKISFSPQMSVQDVLAMALRADQAFVDVYREIAGLAAPRKVREVFEDLAKNAAGERDHFAATFQDLRS